MDAVARGASALGDGFGAGCVATLLSRDKEGIMPSSGRRAGMPAGIVGATADVGASSNVACDDSA